VFHRYSRRTVKATKVYICPVRVFLLLFVCWVFWGFFWFWVFWGVLWFVFFFKINGKVSLLLIKIDVTIGI